jgi:hypothetical protein
VLQVVGSKVRFKTLHEQNPVRRRTNKISPAEEIFLVRFGPFRITVQRYDILFSVANK